MSDLKYLLQRFSDNRESTLGLYFKRITSGIDQKLHFLGYALEDEYRPQKVAKDTRIPANTYELVIQTALTTLTQKYRDKHDWFENHIMLKDVPNYVGVYMHIGNKDDHTDACLLMGDNANNNSIGDGEIQNSTNCFKRFYKELYPHLKAGGRAWIEIRDESKLL
jgi:uncharacterized circularly permuted ATP-grasp superfamily protein